MSTLTLTAAQGQTLSTLAWRGTCTVTALGLPDRPGDVVLHYERSSVVLSVDGCVKVCETEAEAA